MSNANHVSGYRAAKRYRLAAFGLVAAGVLAGIVGSRYGYATAGIVTYVLAALTGAGLLAYVRLSDSLALGDERLCALERRASHYTVGLFAVLGWIAVVGLSLLDATGGREITQLERSLMLGFGAFWVVWLSVYLVLRFR